MPSEGWSFNTCYLTQITQLRTNCARPRLSHHQTLRYESYNHAKYGQLWSCPLDFGSVRVGWTRIPTPFWRSYFAHRWRGKSYKSTFSELTVSLLPCGGIEIGWRVLAAGMSFAHFAQRYNFRGGKPEHWLKSYPNHPNKRTIHWLIKYLIWILVFFLI